MLKNNVRNSQYHFRSMTLLQMRRAAQILCPVQYIIIEGVFFEFFFFVFLGEFCTHCWTLFAYFIFVCLSGDQLLTVNYYPVSSITTLAVKNGSHFCQDFNEMEEVDPHNFVSETSFFIEVEEVLQLISSLSLHENSTNLLIGDSALARLRVVFDKYLECPSLLDPHLEKIVTLLSSNAVRIAHEFYNIRIDDISDAVMNRFDEEETQKIRNLKRILSAIYSISKVRGRKHVQKFLTHDVSDVEPILHALRILENLPEENEIDAESKNWESIYIILVWIGMLSLVPFDLNTIDSSIEHSTGIISGDGNHPTLISSMIMTTRKHLADSGPTREAASYSLSSLLSRPDLEQLELEDFVSFSNSVLKDYLVSEGMSGSLHGATSIFLVMGVVQTLAAIFKTGSRSNLIYRHLKYVEQIWEQAILVADKASAKQEAGQLCNKGGALLLRKLLAKLFARVGCSYLPPRVAEWRYQRGRRSLLENLSSSETVHNSSSKSHPSVQHEQEGEKDDTLDLFAVPDQVEDSMAQLIKSLTDPATTVRWSAAKGIGRVTERLPAVCADDVLDAILDLCTDYENDSAWHGACLSLAELSRRGLLLPERLKEVVPIVIRAIQYDVPRGQHSVGAHVRDAACYTCWAFARAYDPCVLEPFIPTLSRGIIIASIFDREINCRRAASAAFQECVGRQGADKFKHGISILTAADYFTLGNRNDAYTSVAHYVAGFEEYRQPIIRHLYEDKLFHWDKDIRYLSSISLGGLVTLDHVFFIETVLPYLIKFCTHDNLFVRHGAVLGVGEIVLAVYMETDSNILLPEHLLAPISQLVFCIEKARLYRGRGGEIMRSATSRLIECIAMSHIPMTTKQQIGLLDSLDVNLRHPNDEIQKAAAKALYAITRSYFPVGENGPSDRLHSRLVQKYINAIRTEDNPACTRGYSLAIGCLPSKLLAPNHSVLDSVLECLFYAAHHSTLVGGESDAETRRNAIESLSRIIKTVGIGSPSEHIADYPTVPLEFNEVNRIFHALFEALEDYNMDRRGDVGSWSRIAAMLSLEKLVLLATEASEIPHCSRIIPPTGHSNIMPPQVSSLEKRFAALQFGTINSKISSSCMDIGNKENPLIFFTEDLCTKTVGALLKQLSEKLDVIRNQAGISLRRILTSDNPYVPFVYGRQNLIDSLSLRKGQDINWANPESTFPLVMRAIDLDEYFDDILSGIVISVGGLTESVAKSSSKSFLEYLRALKKMKLVGKISKVGHGKFHFNYVLN